MVIIFCRFQKKMILKKAVSERWCKDGSHFSVTMAPGGDSHANMWGFYL